MVATGPLLALSRAIRKFELGSIDISELQSSIASNGSALDSASQVLSDAIIQVDADLEHIQHAMLLEEQRGATVEALGSLLRALESVGASPRREAPAGAPVLRIDRNPGADSAYVF